MMMIRVGWGASVLKSYAGARVGADEFAGAHELTSPAYPTYPTSPLEPELEAQR